MELIWKCSGKCRKVFSTEELSAEDTRHRPTSAGSEIVCSCGGVVLPEISEKPPRK